MMRFILIAFDIAMTRSADGLFTRRCSIGITSGRLCYVNKSPVIRLAPETARAFEARLRSAKLRPRNRGLAEVGPLLPRFLPELQVAGQVNHQDIKATKVKEVLEGSIPLGDRLGLAVGGFSCPN